MTKEEFENLKVGDIVKHKGEWIQYIITGDSGSRKTAVSTAELRNTDEWDVLFKSHYPLWGEPAQEIKGEK